MTLPSYTAVVNAFVALFGTTDRCAELWIAKVRAVWATEEKANREKVRNELDRASKHLFSEAMARGKFAAANGALRTRAMLNGLDGEPSEEQSDDGVDALRKKLAARRAAQRSSGLDARGTDVVEPAGTGNFGEGDSRRGAME